MIEDMAQLHMTEAELARDLHAVLEKVRQGVEVVVDHDCQPVAVLRASDPSRRPPPRRWTPASPAMSKPPSTAIANRWTRRRGTDPRFLRGHRGGAPGPDRVPDAGGDWRAGRRQISASGDGQIHLA